MGLTPPLFSVFEHPVSGRDLVLIFGGLFLVAKATVEIHDDVEGKEARRRSAPPRAGRRRSR
jgi:predicted tellurium resistance membrane protein TerC